MNKIDLTNCDVEPIHIPGKIQKNGFLIGLAVSNFEINYVSENIEEFTGIKAKSFLGKSVQWLSDWLSGHSEIDIAQFLKLGRIQNNFDIINPYKLSIGGLPFYLIIHQSKDVFLLEFETATLSCDLQNIIGKSVSEILSHKTLENLLKSAAKEVKSLIGYDRVMVYKFHDDGHGEVITEVKNDDLTPFFGLHYPASDIPKQARELYKINKIRIIANVADEGAPILSYTEKPLDLTHSVLRAVSPVHIQYLKNMGVASSFSISLVTNNELWGLIACHNYTPKFIDYRAREGTKLIAQILASGLEYRELEEFNEQDMAWNNAILSLSEQLDQDTDLLSALTQYPTNLLHLGTATGVAIVFEDNFKSLGHTPRKDEVLALIRWLQLTSNEIIYQNNNLSATYPDAKKFGDIGSGILALTISRDLGEYIIWFKPEQPQYINWAGNPEKTTTMGENGLMNIAPRQSFAKWSQVVKNTSVKWNKAEMSSAKKIRERIVNAINKKASEIRLLNERLKLAYDELDTFSYTVSHDLRTPLTIIKSYTELFLMKQKDLDAPSKNLLERVLAGADKMNLLIEEILKLAKVGRSDLEHRNIVTSSLVEEIVSEVKIAYKLDNLQVEIGELHPVKGDKTLVSQVFNNIIGNAVKYSSKNKKPKVKIGSIYRDTELIFKICDNGVGIDANYSEKVFELFKRSDNVKEFEGTGVGLAIVKRIMDKHDGRVWFESEVGKGTTFYLAFKNN